MSEGSEDPTTIGPFVVHRKLGEGAMGVVYAGYDVGLDRKVALKLVRKQLLNRPAVRARMIREAQAMARLSSPYVVQVYQVGEHRDGIYVAMEYIDGWSLGDWLKAETRPWQVVLRTLCDAGRGLAAAHAAGLVHRDFKPDNVLVDATGCSRVLDFGLVQSEGGASVGETDELIQSHAGIDETMHSSGVLGDGVDRSNLHWSVRLTQFGRAVGTPAYMSPEQHFGDPVGPLADQFSFAITAYEALYGVRPFNADSWDSLKAQVRQGEVPPPPSDSRVPGWIYKILLRGLALEPEQRWPSMAAMVDALERDPRRARVRVAGIVGLLAVASGASYSVALSQAPEEVDRCAGAAQELAGVWDEPRKAAVARAFAATQAGFADDVLSRVNQRLGTYTNAWVAERTAACEANVVGHQTSNLIDLRVACLGRHRSRLAALVDIFAGADRSVVENAVQAVAALPSIAVCADAETLLAVPPPSDPQTVERVDQLRLQLAQADTLEHAGKYEKGLTLATKVQADATKLEYAPLDAEAALSAGSLWMASGRLKEAETALGRAMKLAIVHELRAVAGEAVAKQIFVLSLQKRHVEALALRTVGEALVERVHDDGRLDALLHNNLGVAYAQSDVYAEASEHFEQSIALLRARPGAPDPLIAATIHNLGSLSLKQGHLDATRQRYTQAREQFITLLGETHPFVAHPVAGLGDLDLKAGAFEEAARNYTQALEIMEAAHGTQHPVLLQSLVGLGRVNAARGRPGEARAYYERGIAIADGAGMADTSLAQALEGLGALMIVADPGRAQTLFERAVEVHAATAGKDSGSQASAALQAGKLAAQLGEPAEAVGWFERVLALPADATVEVRPAAAVALAKQLTARPEATARVCDLLAEAQLSLTETDPLRGEAEALRAGRCGNQPR